MNVDNNDSRATPRPGNDASMRIVDDFISEFQGKYVLESRSDDRPQRGIDLFLSRDTDECAARSQRPAFNDHPEDYSQRLANYLESLTPRSDEVEPFQERYRYWIDELLDRCRWKKLRFYVGADYPMVSVGQVAVIDCRDVPSEDVPVMLILNTAVEIALRAGDAYDVHASTPDSHVL